MDNSKNLLPSVDELSLYVKHLEVLLVISACGYLSKQVYMQLVDKELSIAYKMELAKNTYKQLKKHFMTDTLIEKYEKGKNMLRPD